MKFKFILWLTLTIVIFSSCTTLLYNNNAYDENTSLKITTNQEYFQIDFPKVKDGGYDFSKKRINSTSSYIHLPKFNTKYRTIEITKDNCDTAKLKIKVAPRPLVLALDLGLSLFTFGVPLLVDVFRRDFYEVSKKSKNIYVELKYTQVYMDSQLKKIARNRNPFEYEKYLKDYPYSKNLSIVQDSIERIYLDQIQSNLSSEKIKNYIIKYPNSKYLEEAKELDRKIEESILAFNEAKKSNTIESYELYLSKYPHSVNDKNVKLLLIDVADSLYEKLNNSNSTIYFINNYLSLSKSAYEKSIANKITVLTEQLIQETKKLPYDSIYNNWKTYNNLDKSKIKVSNLSQISNIYKQDLYNYLFLFLQQNSKSKEVQTKLISKISIDFKELFLDQNTILTVIENANNKSGTFTNYNTSFLKNYINRSIEGQSSSGEILCFKDNNSNFDFEIINFDNNIATGGQKIYFTNNQNFEIQTDDKNPISEKEYANGKLTRFHNLNPEYTYEYQNGVNITLQEFNKQIKEGDNYFKKKDYQNALDVYQRLSQNNYPKDIVENTILSSSISKCENAIEKIAEVQRLKEEKDQKNEQRRNKDKLNKSLSNAVSPERLFVLLRFSCKTYKDFENWVYLFYISEYKALLDLKNLKNERNKEQQRLEIMLSFGDTWIDNGSKGTASAWLQSMARKRDLSEDEIYKLRDLLLKYQEKAMYETK